MNYFDAEWEKNFKLAEYSMSDAAAEIKIAVSDCAFCEDDGKFYDGWTEFKVGNMISWPIDFEYDKGYDTNPEGEPTSQEEAVQMFFRGLWDRLEIEMENRFGGRKIFKVRQPLVIFPDESILKRRRLGFYGWVSLVVKT